MKKLLFLYFILLKTLLFGCATCQLMTPMAELNLELKIEKNRLENIHIEWHFSDVYSSDILMQYDKNINLVLDAEELKIILSAKLDYLIPKDMLTQIKISYDEDSTGEVIKPAYKNFDLKMEDKFLVFTYEAVTDVEIKDKTMLSFIFEDDEGFFSFLVDKLSVSENDLFFDQNLYLHTASLYFTKEKLAALNKPKKESEVDVSVAVKESSMQENLLKQSILKIKSLFEDIKDGKNSLSFIILLLFSYAYGLIHALGPGHGKTLVGTYFLSNDRSYSKALFISLMIGVVHTFSAFLLTLVIYFFINQFLAQVLSDTVIYTTKISALIIIAIALYLIYKKYVAYKAMKQKSYNFSTSPHISTCACSSCKVDTNSTDTALIISAGIIPCPGTVTIFIFSLSLGLYYAGFLSALVMSLGMSTIIFISAMISVAVRKKTTKSSSNIQKYLEYASLAVILILGVVLLVA